MKNISKLGVLTISFLMAMVSFSSANAFENPGTSAVIPEPEGPVVFDLVVDVGCEIGLGNDKGKKSPSDQWKYHLEFTDINGYYDGDQILNLTYIIEQLVEEWLTDNVKNDGRRKKMLERYVIVDYSYEITEWPEPPPA